MSQPNGQLGPAVQPVGVYLPRPEVADDVVAPQYSDPTLEESSESAVGGPLGFLNVVRSEVDAPRRDDAARRELMAQTAARLRALLDGDTYNFHAPPIFLVCRLARDGHSQTGVIADVALEAYTSGRVKVHESTRQDQEDRLLEYMSAVRASFLPVFLIHRPSEAVERVIAEGASTTPTIDIEADDGLRMTVWVVAGSELVDATSEALGALDALYVADGHHRAAAAARFAQLRAGENPAHTGAEPYAHIVSVLFSSDQLAIHPYDRSVTVNAAAAACGPRDVLAAVRDRFEVSELPDPARPAAAGEFLMCLGEAWFTVRVPGALLSQPGVAGLDVSVLHDHLLRPVLGIDDPRTDPRLEFLPGPDGPAALDRLCRGPSAVSFALHPTSVDELMDVSDRGEIMPPKSTYFAPKLRSGLVVRLL